MANSTGVRPTRPRLTEENLRLLSVNHQQVWESCFISCDKSDMWSQAFDRRPHYLHQEHHEAKPIDQSYPADQDCGDSDDGETDAMRAVALRKAASLEALQAYGGCFVSGFLAMQEPLPWTWSTSSLEASNQSIRSCGSPRPDSDTLSATGSREMAEEPKRSWRSIQRLRGVGRKRKA